MGGRVRRGGSGDLDGRVVRRLAALVALLSACGGSTTEPPHGADGAPLSECEALCERFPSRVCGTLTEETCLVACEADHTGHPCWPTVMDRAHCVANSPGDGCVDHDTVCPEERARMEACIGPGLGGG